ncbi:allophanate hydrolase subunit 1 [Amycolatopsis acidicola]|uniref:Allophanate hydrolase subunit 1 n=1 Tax=Amycolatopsis acidicola TaxID=2596893 RepID=A0A5N0UVN4_9PSEU|nr:carboxyltransferase domain-containing protein [Amycolatopsis acidicola]KAA9156000.1 allophanate hydrolase subunit 1 [Amycolatopsis acidicola]
MDGWTAAKTEITPCGDAALRIKVDGADSEEVWATVHHLAERLNRGEAGGTVSAVPTYDAVLVEFDPYRTTADELTVRILSQDFAVAPADPAPSRVVDVPVLFGGEHGPDLPWVAEIAGEPVGRVVEMLCEREYLIRCLGGPAASAMTDGPDFRVPIPRLATPRLRVPPGAVSVAGRQAVLGPVAAPSGWRQIGRTPLTILRTEGEQVVPYRAGDRVRFTAIDERTYAALDGVPMRYRDDD